MSQFLARVRNDEQSERTLRVEAAHLAGARRQLEAAGYTEIQILTSESEAQLESLMTQEEREAQALVPPELAAKYREQGDSVVGLLLRNWFVLLWFVTSVWWLASSSSIVAIISSLASLALLLMVVLPFQIYSALIRARHWSSWRTVKVLARALRALTALTCGDVIKSDVEFSMGMAQAGLGDLPGALRAVEHWREKLGPSHYWGRLIGLYAAAHQYDDAIACGERALEAPDGGAEQSVDLALQLIQYRFDRERVRALLASTEGQELGELGAAAVQLCRAAVLVDEQRAAQAVEVLRPTRVTMAKYGVATEE